MAQNQLSRLFKLRVFTLFLALGSVISYAGEGDKPDFTGSFSLSAVKGALKITKADPWLLRIAQTDQDIEITKMADGKSTTNRFKLDGTESPYTTESGVKGVSKARIKGKTLIVETLVIVHPKSNGPAVQTHTKEQWKLSSDLKTLTIRNEVDFPNSGLGGLQLVEPWSEVYTRERR